MISPRDGDCDPCDRYQAWVRDTALPFWAANGFDESAGRFHEQLDLSGAARDVPHRAMVQARQIYVFAHAASSGLYYDGGPMAERAMASLLRDYAEESATELSFAFSINRSGAKTSVVRDAYAHAFILLALATLYQLTGAARCLDLARKTVAFVSGHLTDPLHGGLFEAPGAFALGKRQNPVMHLLEALLALEDAAPGQGCLDQATHLVHLFKTRMFHYETSGLPEYFETDWSPSKIAARPLVMEPGHHFEWAWLLSRYARLSKQADDEWPAALIASACARGFHPNGLIVDEVDLHSGEIGNTHRIWPHTEALKAACIDPSASPRLSINQLTSTLFDTFLDTPFPGGWMDQRDHALAPLVNYVPASSLYHLVLASDVLAQMNRQNPAALC